MNTSNKPLLKVLSLIALICLIIPLSIYGLWIYVIDLVLTQAERVELFHSYFPEIFSGRWATTYLSIFFLIAALIFGSIAVKLSGKLWKMLNIIILVLSSALLFLNLFSLM